MLRRRGGETARSPSAGHPGSRVGRRRRTQCAEQLPDVLDALAGTVRSGASLSGGFSRVVAQSPSPIRDELTPAVGRTRLGADLAAELMSVAERLRSEELAWVAQALQVHARIGGDVGELLTALSESLRTRHRANRQLAALTAESRLSGRVLAVLPVATTALLFFLAPGHVQVLVSTTAGWSLTAAAAGLFAIGVAWMRGLIRSVTW